MKAVGLLLLAFLAVLASSKGNDWQSAEMADTLPIGGTDEIVIHDGAIPIRSSSAARSHSLQRLSGRMLKHQADGHAQLYKEKPTAFLEASVDPAPTTTATSTAAKPVASTPAPAPSTAAPAVATTTTAAQTPSASSTPAPATATPAPAAPGVTNAVATANAQIQAATAAATAQAQAATAAATSAVNAQASQATAQAAGANQTNAKEDPVDAAKKAAVVAKLEFCKPADKCKNGGICSPVLGKCKCQPRWEGETCEIDMETPAPLNTPINMIPAYQQCICAGAVPVPCANYPSKSVTTGANETAVTTVKYTCLSGADAIVSLVPSQIVLKSVSALYPCHTVPCQNGGSCVKGQCSCASGYSGLLCHVDKCDEEKINCQKGGVCKGGKCNCSQGWIGTYCERDACEIRSCANGGRCVTGKGLCECPPDWEGDDCTKVSKLGLSRSTFEKAIGRLEDKVRKLNKTLASVSRAVDSTVVAKQITKGMAKALAQANDRNDAASNIGEQESAYVPHFMPGPDGVIRYDMQISPEDKEKMIGAVYVPSNIITDLSSLSRARRSILAAKAWHEEWSKRLPAIQKMALLEQDTQMGGEHDVDEEGEEDVEEDASDSEQLVQSNNDDEEEEDAEDIQE